ncbi:hypothetical protein R50072_30910 [Simiduia litorea]|uniref:hypothetical protein n=1 Tax=Simiduia litorea TaxID=1435348 RepID=UPI0036F30C2B
MIEIYKKFLPTTIGIFLSLACVLSLAEFFRDFHLQHLNDSFDHFQYLIMALVFGFIGIPMSLDGTLKLSSDEKL